MHTIDRHAEQLRLAGVREIFPLDLDWAAAGNAPFDLPQRYALLVPGGSAHRPRKRWPIAQYIQLARHFAERSVTPALLGGDAERTELEQIVQAVPEAVNLGGKTSFQHIVQLGRQAVAAVGNDTGPMHLIAGAQTPSLVLFSDESDPARCAPRGTHVRILRRPSLAELTVEEVVAALNDMSVLA